MMRWMYVVATLEPPIYIGLLSYLKWTRYELFFTQRRAEDLVGPSSALACYLQLHGKRLFLQIKSEYLGQQLFDIDNCRRNIQVTLIWN